MGFQQSFVSYGGNTEYLKADLKLYAQRDTKTDEAHVIGAVKANMEFKGLGIRVGDILLILSGERWLQKEEILEKELGITGWPIPIDCVAFYDKASEDNIDLSEFLDKSFTQLTDIELKNNKLVMNRK